MTYLPRKIFCLGFNKSGTTSLHDLFKNSGLKSYHGKSYSNFFYDAFSDGNQLSLSNFKYYHAKFPDSFFLLNTRSFAPWVTSRFKHGYIVATSKNLLSRLSIKAGVHNPLTDLKPNWGWPCTVDMIIHWAIARYDHHFSVISYFQQFPNNFACVNIERENWIDFVKTAFDLPPSSQNNLHSNRRDSSMIPNSIMTRINNVVSEGVKVIEAQNYSPTSYACLNTLGFEKTFYSELKALPNFYL